MPFRVGAYKCSVDFYFALSIIVDGRDSQQQRGKSNPD